MTDIKDPNTSNKNSEEAEAQILLLKKKAQGFLYFPWGIAIGLSAAGVAFAAGTLWLLDELGSELVRGHLTVAVVACLASVFFYGSYSVFRTMFDPVGEDGIDILSRFAFNEIGKAHLKRVAAQRDTVRDMDLRKALQLHFRHKAAIENEALTVRRGVALQRFVGQD